MSKPMHAPLRNMMTERGIADPEAIMPFTLLSNARLKAIISALDMIKDIPGETAEIGCHAGGTTYIIGAIAGRTHWAVDTFKGLQDVCDADETLYNGQFSATQLTLASVKKRVKSLQNVKVLKGYFPDCAPQMADLKYAFVHIDVDSYMSMRACIDYFVPRMSIGGIIAMDDVIGKGTPGGKKAWAETKKKRFSIISENDPQVIVRIEK